VAIISQASMARPQELVNSYQDRILTRDGTIDLKYDEKVRLFSPACPFPCLCAPAVCALEVLTRTLLVQMEQKQNLLQYLRQDKDVSRPVQPKLHALTLTPIMQQNQQDVDDLRPVGPTAHMAVGPDGLRDEGSLSDLSLLAGMSHENTVDADQMNAIDARHAVPMPQLYDINDGHKHDMMMNADKIDTKAKLALAQAKSRNTGFRMVSGVAIGSELDGNGVHDPFHKLASYDGSDVHKIKDRFHAMPITKKEAKASQTSAAEDWTVPTQQTAQQPQETDGLDNMPDLGEEGPAEASSDPMPQPKADEGPGIWIEPGSNKGYDSFALDSLQVKDQA